MDSDLKFVVQSGHPVKTAQTPGKLQKCPAGRSGKQGSGSSCLQGRRRGRRRREPGTASLRSRRESLQQEEELGKKLE